MPSGTYNCTVRKILVSACLLGANVRYHGGNALSDHPLLRQWDREGRLVPVCPEVAGGLSTPRPPAEIRRLSGSGTARLAVMTRQGDDVSAAYRAGARTALELARQHDIRIAILKDGSPSCASTAIHDGAFTGARVPGAGITAALLREAGVQVFGEDRIDEAAAHLAALDEEEGHALPNRAPHAGTRR